jgi:predicted DCC family thiol-disulfide oxidoreductase YuxK
MINQLPEGKKIIIFDGVCNLCNSSINYVIDNDKNDIFRFVSLQSDLGIALQNYLGIEIDNIDSIILYNPNEAYYLRSTAALKIMKEFSGLWKLSAIAFLLPRIFRDKIYDFIASNRYKWFGKEDNCRLITPELKSKFL